MRKNNFIRALEEMEIKDSGSEQDLIPEEPAPPLSPERQAEVDRETENAVKREIRHIMTGCAICSLITCLVFLVLGSFTWSVLWGVLLGSGFAIASFVFLGRSVQKAVEMGGDGQRYLQKTYTLRLLLTAAGVVLAVKLPFIHSLSGVIPVFFPRLTIFGMQLLGMYKPDKYKS